MAAIGPSTPYISAIKSTNQTKKLNTNTTKTEDNFIPRSPFQAHSPVSSGIRRKGQQQHFLCDFGANGDDSGPDISHATAAARTCTVGA